MATTQTLTPAVGAAPSFTQTGTGATPGYSAVDFRRMVSYGPIQEGVVEAGSFMVTQRAAGANMSVDVAASTGSAYVQGDSITLQGLYYVPPHTAVVNLDVAASDATNPRVDSVYLEVKDDTHDAGGLNLARLRYVTGTASAGATLDNRTGAPANPGSACLLADVLVAAAAVSVSNTSIRDRRPWARGAFYRKLDTSGTKTTTASLGMIDATNLNPRIECSGAPVRMTLVGMLNATAVSRVAIQATVDTGTAVDSWDASSGPYYATCPVAASTYMPMTMQYTFTPSVGSHKIGPAWLHITAAWTLLAAATQPLALTIEEIVTQNTANNLTTSG